MKKTSVSKDIQSKVEQLLLNYMDGFNFEDGYIPDLYDVSPLRDDVVKLIQDLLN